MLLMDNVLDAYRHFDTRDAGFLALLRNARRE